ncbi:hypothetical protein [Saliphagus sp. LR7]|uniref:hypothetical protein n=1 Tax=Saliphagus sp. LR7 TaxID=2282654 RepID=UPI000DF77C17|nr:hypothetical protein [Saliphagus sp. LR7]
MGFEAWQQYRSVHTPAFDVVAQGEYNSDVHMEVSVSHDKDDGLSGEATIYNLAEDKWTQLSEGDPFRIELGYRGEITKPVIFGEVGTKQPGQVDGADTAYKFSGADESEKRIKEVRETESWEEPTVDFIARDLARLADLRPGRITVPGGVIGDSWSISQQSTLDHWFDRIVEEAEDLGDEKYEWYATRGQVNVVPKAEDVGAQIDVLTEDKQGNVLDSGEVEGKEKKSDGGSNVEVEALLDPQIEKDALVPIRTEKINGVYRIVNYSLTSSTENGDHEMELEAAPTDSEYRYQPAGQQTDAGIARPY